jgi:ATP-binding cassette subfamily B (MDR/TAP) protein 1
VLNHRFQRVVILKAQHNKKTHEGSAQVACEAAGAIRTVASLTREDDCLDFYSKSLEGPLRESKRTSFWGNLLFSLSQSFSFFVISLTFWYGSRLVSYQEFTTKEFFVALMVSKDGHQKSGVNSQLFSRPYSVPSRQGMSFNSCLT